MKQTKYVGLFVADNGSNYTLTCYCFSFFQALFLLTADAIRSGRHYQLFSITDENENTKVIDDIIKVGGIIN